MPGLFIAEGQAVSAEAEFDGVPKGSATHDFNLSTVTEAHFKETPAKLAVAAYGDDPPATTHAQTIKPACFDRPAMTASREVTRLFLRLHSNLPHRTIPADDVPEILLSLRLSFNKLF
jgi:hypothetical protein